jgi:hypothetical protein
MLPFTRFVFKKKKKKKGCSRNQRLFLQKEYKYYQQLLITRKGLFIYKQNMSFLL